ncbi:hypothetical protein BS17DRAFT_855786 [Gyrodon lividus]|nr:hypothetical protein BS17DRAFT_855786 [Gyrodon lividus]
MAHGDIQVTTHIARTRVNDPQFQQNINDELGSVLSCFREHLWRKSQSLMFNYPTQPQPGIIHIETNLSQHANCQLLVTWSDQYGYGIFHNVQPQENGMLAVRWFKNVAFFYILQGALYNPQSEGWFAFLEDTPGSDSVPCWQALSSAQLFTAATAAGWLISTLKNDYLGAHAFAHDSVSDGCVASATTFTTSIYEFFLNVLNGWPRASVEEQNIYRQSLVFFIRKFAIAT